LQFSRRAEYVLAGLMTAANNLRELPSNRKIFRGSLGFGKRFRKAFPVPQKFNAANSLADLALAVAGPVDDARACFSQFVRIRRVKVILLDFGDLHDAACIVSRIKSSDTE
jgi:hypothetical protein